MRQIHNWIDDEVVASTSGRVLAVTDPATGEQSAVVNVASLADVHAAVAAASSAAEAWAASSLSSRARLFFELRALMSLHKDEIAGIITHEHGKVLDDARAEVERGIENIQFAAGIPHLLKGSHSSAVSSHVDVFDFRQPLGVVVGITPFNFPAMVPLWMIANALACGNTFVLKPSEKTPSAALRIAELIRDAGFPRGVFNVVNGDRTVAEALTTHPAVGAVSFVGSTPVARSVFRAGSEAGRRVQALGGAKNHLVIMPDADIDASADTAVSAGYGSAGERCMAVSVVVVVGGGGDEVVAAIASRIATLVVGPGDAESSDMGPLVTHEHRLRVVDLIDRGVAAGARVVVDGRGIEAPAGYDGGFWLGPTLLDHVARDNPAYTNEIFGPVLCIVRVATIEEAIDLLNRSDFGNGAVIMTRDGGAARRFTSEVQCGMIGINVGVPAPVGSFSFGGWKDSLFGDTSIQGPEGIRFYTRNKVVTSTWPGDRSSVLDLSFPESS